MSSTLAGKPAETFDPYHRWLGIRDPQRPPNHYRLLGLEPFEDDPEVIGYAAERHLGCVRKQRFGQHAELAKQVLVELEAAKATLLDRQQKSIYDGLLRQQLALQGGTEPAGQPGRAAAPMECHKCGASNSPDRKFCAGCGALLWNACAGCGAVNAAGEQFCGRCGVNLEEAVRRRVEHLETQEAYALSLQVACKHREAISVLEQLALVEHPQDAGHGQRVRALLAEVRSDLARLEQKRDLACPLARQLVARHDYDGAAKVLDDVPEPLRTEEIRKLAGAVQVRRQELAALSAEIRDAMLAREYDGLLHKVERVLAIKPDHAAALNLVDKLRKLAQSQEEQNRDSLCAQARKHLQEHAYESALAALEEVAESAANEESRKLLDYAREVAWLSREVREPVCWHEQLLPIAQRLLKLRPADPHAGKFAELLKREGRAALKSANGFVPPERSEILGVPLEMLPVWRRINIEQVRSAPVFQAQHAAFHVAAGLALQGLGQGAVTVNLRPQDKEGLLKRFSLRRSKPARSIWGLDLGECALRALRLSWDAKEGRAVAEAFDYVEYAKPLNPVEPDAEALAKEALAQFASRHGAAKDPVCLGFSSQELLSRFLNLPSADDERLADLVQYEARQQIPFPLDEVAWDYQPLAADISAEEIATRQVALFATKRAPLKRRLGWLEEAGLKADLVQADALALANLAAFDRLAPQPQAPQPQSSAGSEALGLIDIGARKTNVVFVGHNLLWLRVVPLGGHDFTKPLIRGFKLTAEKAEDLKRRPTTAPEVNKVYLAMQPVFQELSAELGRSLERFSSSHPRTRIARVYCTGGGFKLHGLFKFLLLGR